MNGLSDDDGVCMYVYKPYERIFVAEPGSAFSKELEFERSNRFDKPCLYES